ncbi:hypothetical protein CEXT_420091 [Caerostris extrusa]|uniref:Uncharacterized protein n=1 Tax=Caerostris extrusa TaxID=172846 RepID=A0AAV4XU51_CAEEX|nr:hypothetical protein CEXT_420091 [Caerostris extrusa]
MLCAGQTRYKSHAHKPPQRRCHLVIRSRLRSIPIMGETAEKLESRTDFPTLSDDSNNWIVNLASWNEIEEGSTVLHPPQRSDQHVDFQNKSSKTIHIKLFEVLPKLDAS